MVTVETKVSPPPAAITLFLCGDVMIGRGIDQILPYPSKPELYEPYADSALDYVAMAEKTNGPIPRSVDFSYVWGDALAELERVSPAARIIKRYAPLGCPAGREMHSPRASRNGSACATIRTVAP